MAAISEPFPSELTAKSRDAESGYSDRVRWRLLVTKV
jgi:hypothetical protein